MAENKYQYSYQYPHPAVTTDCVVFGYDVAPEDRESKKKNKRMALQVLLIERGGEPYKGCWALPGGFLRSEDYDGRPADENVEACALRELREETGVDVDSVEQFKVYSELSRDPRERVISIAFAAYFDKRPAVTAADDAAEARWFPVNALPPLAFDHAEMLRDVQELINPT